MDLLLIIGAGMVLLLVLGAGIALVAGAGSSNVDERIDQFVGVQTFEPQEYEDEPFFEGPDVRDRIDQAFEGQDFSERIRRRLSQADLKLRVYEYIILQFVAAGLAGIIVYLLFRGNLIVAGAGAVFGLFIPRIVVNRMATRRLRTFEGQLSDTLNLWVNSLKSGYSVLQGMESIATEMPEPTRIEFERVVQEVRLGLSLDDALHNMLRRVPSEDLDLVVTAVNIQREVGGNLAEVLDIISFTIRERVRIKREIRTLTAQVRASAWVVTALPFALSGILYLLNPEYVSQLIIREDPFVLPGIVPCGWLMIGIGLLMMGIGSFMISRIVDIEV